MNTLQNLQTQAATGQFGLATPFLTYILYIAVSIALTFWVARTLSSHGRIFLVRVFNDEALADSVNHLLVVGFCLINFGYASFTLKMGIRPHDPVQALEELSLKIGAVLVVLGIMHFFNLLVFSKISANNSLRTAPPPVSPTERI
jgi:hypothetical protein